MSIRDLEKERAIFAYEKVEEFLEKNSKLDQLKKEIEEKNINCKNNNHPLCQELKKLQLFYHSKSEYKSYCKKIPSLIQTNGLSSTFAFMFSKRKGTYMVIYNQIDEWLKKRYKDDDEIVNNKELVERLIKLQSSKYRKITIEVLALFNWLRRFAEGKISKDG